VGQLEEKLENEGFLTEDIEKIIRCCEKLVVLEQQIEQAEHQWSQIEIPPK
jgi:uncharacterized protein Smg (DUF494 family)